LAACADTAPTEVEVPLTAAASVDADVVVEGAVFTSSNDAAGNAVIVYPRLDDGRLLDPTSVPTGGLGAGAGLGSQGAVTLSDDGRWLFVVDAGSDEVSVFSVNGTTITQTDRVPSGGDFPVSVTHFGSRVFVLNGQGVNNVTGFELDSSGRLTPIPGGTAPLSADDTAPAQISFGPFGRSLVVTEKATNIISSYRLDSGGVPELVETLPSTGATPFGFEFSGRYLLISEAAGGAPGASSASSYRWGSPSNIQARTGPVASNQTAACWLIVTPNGRRAFVSNTGSGTISTYGVRNGQLSLVQEVAANTGAGSTPLDMALTSTTIPFVYVIAPGNQTIRPYAAQDDGTLVGLGPLSGLPATAFGLAAF